MGFKPRPHKSMELTMQAHGAGFSREATINLRTGHCTAVVTSHKWRDGTRKRLSRKRELTIPSRQLGTLRATASTILAAGNTHHREQFAQMGVSFCARSAGSTATASFDIDVGSSTTYDGAWKLVFRHVDAALKPG